MFICKRQQAEVKGVASSDSGDVGRGDVVGVGKGSPRLAAVMCH